MQDDNDQIVKRCFSCKQRGRLAASMIENDVGVWRSTCVINVCTNPKCFRSFTHLPNGWKYLTQDDNYQFADLVHDKREPRVLVGQSYAKNKNDRAATLDAQGARVRGVEVARHGGLHRRYQDAPSPRNVFAEHRHQGQAVPHQPRPKRDNGLDDILVPRNPWRP